MTVARFQKLLSCRQTGMKKTGHRYVPASLNSCAICGSTRINRRNDIGWDIWESGEEDQHLETCLDCGATRLIYEWFEYERGEGISYGKWRKDDMRIF